MNLGTYVINLERGKERLRSISEACAFAGIEFERVDAVDGRSLAQDQWHEMDFDRWRNTHGADPLPGEYGCYVSHIKALRTFAESDYDSALIMEDDAVPTSKANDFCKWLNAHFCHETMLVRLSFHRNNFFRPLNTQNPTAAIGQCWHGPTGSAAAYWVTRKAATRLLDALLPIYLPYDIMLERPWATKVPAFLTSKNVIDRRLFDSQITHAESRHAHKFSHSKRISTYWFRFSEINRLISYNMTQGRFPIAAMTENPSQTAKATSAFHQ